MPNPVGRPTDYRPDFHPTELMRLMKEKGYQVAQCCRDWEISRDTFYNWCYVHKEFSDAYKIGRESKEAWWWDAAQGGMFTEKGTNFNAVAWSMAMRAGNGVNTDERKIAMPELQEAKTFDEQTAVVKRYLSEGKITTKEAKAIQDVIATGAKVHEVTELKTKLEAVEDKLKANNEI
jgi:hypothetical protein